MNGLQPTSAFVVQFRAGGDIAADDLAGRVEHVASGRAANFESVQELPALLRRMWTECASEFAECCATKREAGK